MIAWLKLSHHHHTGQLRSHEHTSYAPLGVLLVLVGFILTAYTAYAATPYVGPEAGSVAISGRMPAKPPTVAATITKPSNNQHFATSPVEVSGTCTKTTLVEIFKNNIFGGAVPCDDNGTYTVQVDLLFGKNVLFARVYDALNQAGPDSNKVTAYYDASAAQSDGLASLNFSDTQLLLNTDAVFRGSFPGQEMTMPVQILGGSAPYAVSMEWGDSKNTLYPRKNNLGFSASHTYSKPGTYQVTIQTTDAGARVAFLTVAVVVNGKAEVAGANSDASNTKATGLSATIAKLLTLWPLYTIMVAIVTSFWFGERREKRILADRGFLVSSQRTF